MARLRGVWPAVLVSRRVVCRRPVPLEQLRRAGAGGHRRRAGLAVALAVSVPLVDSRPRPGTSRRVSAPGGRSARVDADGSAPGRAAPFARGLVPWLLLSCSCSRGACRRSRRSSTAGRPRSRRVRCSRRRSTCRACTASSIASPGRGGRGGPSAAADPAYRRAEPKPRASRSTGCRRPARASFWRRLPASWSSACARATWRPPPAPRCGRCAGRCRRSPACWRSAFVTRVQRHRRDAGAGVHADRRAVPILRAAAGLAGRGADRLGHVSNALFGSLQKITAQQLGLNPDPDRAPPTAPAA